MALTHVLALELVQRCISEASRRDVAVAAVVVDTGGRMVAQVRMDGVGYVATRIAAKKATGSATFGAPTAALSDFMASDSKLASFLLDEEFSLVPGGVPVIVEGVVVGGLGLSGGHYSQDEAIVAAALGRAESSPDLPPSETT